MHYALFIPKAMGADPKLLDTVGLGHLVQKGDVSPLMQELPGKGPDGGPGLLFVWPPSMPAYIAGQMTWQPAKPDSDKNLPAGRFWWGYDPTSPPTAADLIRKKLTRGNPCAIENDLWLVPNVLMLPHKFALGDDGEEVRQVISTHAAVYDRGMWAYDLLKGQVEERAKAPGKEMRRYVVEMLALNYRIFLDLAYHLDLLTDETWFSLACATVDLDTLLQIEADVAKKKREALIAAVTPPTSTPGGGAAA